MDEEAKKKLELKQRRAAREKKAKQHVQGPENDSDCWDHKVLPCLEREFIIGHLLVRIHLIIVMIRRTGLAQWEFDFPFLGSLTSTFFTLS